MSLGTIILSWWRGLCVPVNLGTVFSEKNEKWCQASGQTKNGNEDPPTPMWKTFGDPGQRKP